MTPGMVAVDAPIAVDGSVLAAAFGDRPVALRHRLVGHPALSTDALAAVAERHPGNLIEHHVADLPLVLPTGEARMLPLTPREVIDGLADNGCWVVLWSIDRVAPYGRLVDEWLAPVRALAPGAEGRLGPSEALALLASPGAIVPAHVDNNHNVLLQLRGSKDVFVGEFTDRSDTQRQIERRYGPAALNLDRLPEHVTRFTLGPGDALYIPPFTIHWVVGGPQVSAALSCSFTTEDCRRAQQVHACNARLRRLRISPRPPGESRARDQTKVLALRSWGATRRLATGARRRLAPARSGVD